MSRIIKAFLVVAIVLALIALWGSAKNGQKTPPTVIENPSDTISEDLEGNSDTMSSLEEKVEEATRTLPQCRVLDDFYWVMGDKNGALISGSTGSQSVTEDSAMDIASATKIVYAAYVAEKNNGLFSNDTIQKLNFTSGYTKGNLCFATDTPLSCFSRGENKTQDPAQIGKFYYGPGHILALSASDPEIMNLRGGAIGEVVRATLGFHIDFNNPKLAGSGVTTPEEYGVFLTKMVRGEYELANVLGSHSVCTNPVQCPGAASETPIPESERWEYSLGHWVENDPERGDGSFSSPGAFGFYPWIDRTKNYWGILARKDNNVLSAAIESVNCGRELRKIFIDAM